MDGLKALVADFAAVISMVDGRQPVWTSSTTGKAYQPGIGPHPETATVDLVVRKLATLRSSKYSRAQIGVPYPSMKRQKCDLLVGLDGEDWYVEIKMMRLMGDNGKPNDNILTHLLSPYPEHRSALTDCRKLVASGFEGRHAVLIYGYEYDGWPLELVIDAFECLACREARLSERATPPFADLVHPIHRSGRVFGWEVKPLLDAVGARA